MPRGRVQSCVPPVDAAHIAAGPNEVRGSGPNQFGGHQFEIFLAASSVALPLCLPKAPKR